MDCEHTWKKWKFHEQGWDFLPLRKFVILHRKCKVCGMIELKRVEI